MTRLFVFFLLVIILDSCSKDKSPEPKLITRDSVYLNEVYANNVDWLGERKDLKMDVLLPVAAYTNGKDKNFPFLLFIHGGGYNKGDKSIVENYLILLAKKGYVVASIDYRTGWRQDEKDRCNADPVQANQA